MKILIVGDSCTDVFVYGDVTRLSPEAPVPVFNPLRKTENYGMARNVANNVEALESVIYTITNKNSIRKVRYVEDKSNQLILRVDEHDYCDRIDDDTLSSIQDNKCHITMAGTVK
jgi:bifunctional ADP-heptose synthase (sugar kinase/adenylyltransferase)